MPRMYEFKPEDYATTSQPSDLDMYPDGAEQEHKDSCDINKMIKSSMNGKMINGSMTEQIYGYDDTTMDAITHINQKQQLEAELSKSAKDLELSEQEIALIPESVKQRFKFRLRREEPVPAAPTTGAAPSAQDAPTQPKAGAT